MTLTLEAPSDSKSGKVTIRNLRQWVEMGEAFAMLTCYDATTARWLWRSGLRCILVGDTAAQVILGHDSTLPVSMSFMLEITAAVRRGAPDVFLMADMPFGSYHCGEDEALRNAIAFLKDAGADAVKLEVDTSFAPLVARIAAAGVPVVAHLGSRPQQVKATGGYRAEGRTTVEADAIVDAATLMISRGATMLLLEAVPNEVSQQVVSAATAPGVGQIVPVVGCGAGSACHGHVVVLQDLMGLTDRQPPFITPMNDMGDRLCKTARQWIELVKSREYLKDDHPYSLLRV